jgi:hypothetical protein
MDDVVETMSSKTKFSKLPSKGYLKMSRIKSISGVLALTLLVGIASQAYASVTVKVNIAGLSSGWQSIALAAYNNGTSLVSGGGQTFHYTSSSNFNLVDSRGATTTDTGQIWIVWDSASAGANVWAYISVDAVTGDRCYFAVPKCTVTYPSSSLPTPANAITVWPDSSSDTQPPSAVAALFANASQSVNAAATDLRPEDAVFATCRANSPLGAGSAGGSASDGLDGLGYSQAAATQTSGACFTYTTASQGAINGIGHPILSGYPKSTKSTNVLSFAISGKDPITGSTVAAYTVYAFGAAPIIFITNRQNNLKNLVNVSDQQLQQVFSGTNCDGSAFGSAFAGPINIFERDPLSGAYNTTESTVLRYPTVYPNPVQGLSQETNVNAPANNYELNGYASACASGTGQRWRTIGSSEQVKAVYNSNSSSVFSTSARDGIGYIYFSYGNVNTSGSTLSDSANYGYLKLNGVDPIWASYGIGKAIDPGQPTGAGQLPSQADLPSAAVPTGCASSFPCPENLIWGSGASFPNLRNGTYRAWSVLRLIATGSAGTNVSALVTAAEKSAVLTTPDFVPAASQTITASENPFGYAITDKGLVLLRSHYQQYDGAVNEPTGSEKGGDSGGLIIPTSIGVTLSASASKNTENQIQVVQSSNPDGDLSPALRSVKP